MIIFIHWFLCFQILMIDIRNVISFYPFMFFYFSLRIVCGFITGSFYRLSFPTCPLKQKMTWKEKMMMGLYTSISSMEIGKNTSVTWKTMGCVRSTTKFTVYFPRLDWFGWGNVWFPQFWGGKIPFSFSYWGLVLYLLNTSSL